MANRTRMLGVIAIVVVAAAASAIAGGLSASPGSASAPAPPWIQTASKTGYVAVHGNDSVGRIGSMSLPAGSYLVTAKVELSNTSANPQRLGCGLTSGPHSFLDAAATSEPGYSGSIVENTVVMTAPVVLHAAGKVTVSCATTGPPGSAGAYYTVVTAVRAGTLQHASLQ